MGLVDKAEKKKPSMYFEEDKPKEVKPVFLKPQIKEKDDAPEHISLETGKLHVHREEDDAVKAIESKIEPREKIEKETQKEPHMASIKEAIKTKLKRKNGEQKTYSKDRISTGVPGLDDIMEGGFRINTVNLIGGGAGCGKSIFCMQFLVDGIERYDEPGVYISFEENEDKLLKDFERFNWNLKKKIDEKKLAILYYTPEQVERVLEAGGGVVRDVIEGINAKRLVIDSLTAFTLLFETEFQKRKAVLALYDVIQKWGCTALMTSEQEPDPEKHKSTIMEFETDGVILLYNIRKGDIRERSLEIFKMRATKHAQKIFPMKITENGLVIYPGEEVF